MLKAEKRENLRIGIKNVARDMLVEGGYESLSMRKIATATGYTPAAIYRYFSDKKSLVRELCDDEYRSFFSKLLEKVEKEKSLAKRLEMICFNYVEFATGNPQLYKILFLEPIIDYLDNDSEIVSGSSTEDGYTIFVNCVRDALIASNSSFQKKYKQCAQLIWSTMHGTATLENSFSDEPWFDLKNSKTATKFALDRLFESLEIDK